MQRTPCFVVEEFSLVLGVRFCMAFLIRIREFFLRRFRASGAVVSGFGSSSFLFLLLLPPFSSWGRLGSLFFSPSCVLAGPQRLGGRQVRAEHGTWHVFLLFFFSLCPGRLPSPLPCLFLSFSLSIFSVFLACKHLRVTDSWVTSGKCSPMGIDIVIGVLADMCHEPVLIPSLPFVRL